MNGLAFVRVFLCRQILCRILGICPFLQSGSISTGRSIRSGVLSKKFFIFGAGPSHGMWDFSWWSVSSAVAPRLGWSCI